MSQTSSWKKKTVPLVSCDHVPKDRNARREHERFLQHVCLLPQTMDMSEYMQLTISFIVSNQGIVKSSECHQPQHYSSLQQNNLEDHPFQKAAIYG